MKFILSIILVSLAQSAFALPDLQIVCGTVKKRPISCMGSNVPDSCGYGYYLFNDETIQYRILIEPYPRNASSSVQENIDSERCMVGVLSTGGDGETKTISMRGFLDEESLLNSKFLIDGDTLKLGQLSASDCSDVVDTSGTVQPTIEGSTKPGLPAGSSKAETE